MPNREHQRATREKRLEILAAKVRAPGEFVHLDRRTPRLASGAVVTKAALKALQDRGVVSIVQHGLDGRPMQFAAPGALRGADEALIADRSPSWTAKRRADARAMWMSGQTKEAVARAFGTSRGRIVAIAKQDRWPAERA